MNTYIKTLISKNRDEIYIAFILLITLSSILISLYLFRIYAIQRTSIQAQFHSFSVSKTLNKIAFNSRKLILLDDNVSALTLIDSLNKTNKLLMLGEAILHEDSRKEYQKFNRNLIVDLELLTSYREKDKALSAVTLQQAKVGYDELLKFIDLDVKSTNSAVISTVKEIMIDIFALYRIDRDFQLARSITKKLELTERFDSIYLQTKNEVKNFADKIEDENVKQQLEKIGWNLSYYNKVFTDYSKNNLNYIKVKRSVVNSYLKLNDIANDNSDRQHQYLDEYNNSTKIFLYSLVAFFVGTQLFNYMLFRSYSKSNKIRKLERSKSEEKSRFLARMSHEIRTPLNGIIGTVGIMKNDQENHKDSHSDQINQHLETLNYSSITLKNHIDNVLDLSKIESGVMEVNDEYFSLDDLFSQVKKIIAPLINNGNVHLNFSGSSDYEIFLDKTKLRQILLNYLSNAIKYFDSNKQHSIIDVGFDIKAISNTRCLINIMIKDNGVGMSEKSLQRFALPYSQFMSHSDNSSGLGASVAKEYLQLLNGFVTVKSELDVGTEIGIYLKSSYAIHDKKSACNTKIRRVCDRRCKVLVVEDNLFNRQIITAQLVNLGCVVFSVEDGLIAKKHLLENRHYDLIVTDIKMPNLDGIQLTKFIRENISKSLPILALTADALKEDHLRFNQVGINMVLTKPVQIDDLSVAINNMLKCMC